MYKNGNCSLRGIEVLTKEWCKDQSVLLNRRKGRWVLTHINECPVCGKGSKHKEHVYNRPKPENPADRINFTMNYDYCLEEAL